jgi:hypothetical protein
MCKSALIIDGGASRVTVCAEALAASFFLNNMAFSLVMRSLRQANGIDTPDFPQAFPITLPEHLVGSCL